MVGSMMRWVAVLAVVVCSSFAAEQLPDAEETQPLEIEPPLLIPNRANGASADSPQNAPADVDIARLETDLTRAKKSAAAGERLFKAGILAQVEAEERALRVVRIEAKLANAQVEAAKEHLEELKSASSADETFARELRAAEALVAEATQNASRATEAKRTAEVEAAARNVERQQKLLTLGSGRKADVSRAQEKLAELRQAAE